MFIGSNFQASCLWDACLMFCVGICLIISNEIFFSIPHDSQSKKMPDRPGTEKDCGECLHFIVRDYR